VAFAPGDVDLDEELTRDARLLMVLIWLDDKLGTFALVGLALSGLYALYVVKRHLGIDVFPEWGLHLPGPRRLAKIIARKLGIAWT
jgi:hypothetical protein